METKAYFKRKASNKNKFSKAYFKAWHKANPDKLPAYMRKQSLSKRGLTPATYEEMHVAQSGVCPICTEPETQLGSHGKVKRLAIDHDHKHPDAEAKDLLLRRAAVRGLLCTRCNQGIGLLRHDPDSLERAAAYLRTFQTAKAS